MWSACAENLKSCSSGASAAGGTGGAADGATGLGRGRGGGEGGPGHVAIHRFDARCSNVVVFVLLQSLSTSKGCEWLGQRLGLEMLNVSGMDRIDRMDQFRPEITGQFFVASDGALRHCTCDDARHGPRVQRHAQTLHSLKIFKTF